MSVKRLQRILVSVIACSAMLLTTNSVAIAQDDVKNSKHNLSILSGGADPTSSTALVDYGEICVYCHTPHGGQVEAPLWNRAFSSATYQMYTSATIDMAQDGAPTGVSAACLSCHDGTIGLDVIVNAPNKATAFVIPGTTSGTNTIDGNENLGSDLRNDHPISIAYDPVADPAFNTEASILTAGLRLFTDPSAPTVNKVQCASCHNPHNDTNTPFLRIANGSSTLCTTCHIK